MPMQVIAQRIRDWNTKLFQIPAGQRSWYSVILWWESRRIPYNAIVGFAGFIAILLMFLIVLLPPQDPQLHPGDILGEPLTFVVFAVMANIMYTFGWIVELINRTIRQDKAVDFGSKFFRRGLLFSLFLVMVPVVLHAVAWIMRLFGHTFQ